MRDYAYEPGVSGKFNIFKTIEHWYSSREAPSNVSPGQFNNHVIFVDSVWSSVSLIIPLKEVWVQSVHWPIRVHLIWAIIIQWTPPLQKKTHPTQSQWCKLGLFHIKLGKEWTQIWTSCYPTLKSLENFHLRAISCNHETPMLLDSTVQPPKMPFQLSNAYMPPLHEASDSSRLGLQYMLLVVDDPTWIHYHHHWCNISV